MANRIVRAIDGIFDDFWKRAGKRAHSDFILGLYDVLRIPWRLRAAMALLIEWTESENWG